MRRSPEDLKPKGAPVGPLRWVPPAFTLLLLALVFLSPVRTNSRLALTVIAVGCGLLVWWFALWRQAGRAGTRLQTEFAPVRAHYVQASVQLCVFVYWGWYWPKVYAEAPLILSQVLFLYVFSALLSWSLGRVWRFGFGVLPIIFSTNLFLWFNDDWFVFQYLMVATGALGKEFIQWQRDGRKVHIFNPSAFGLFLFSLALILTGTSQYTWGWEIATTLGRPPFIYAQIFLLGLIVQGLFGVTLMTFSAAATLCVLNLVYTQTTGVYFFVDSNIPIAVFLGLHLLMTDPATTPRTNTGKFIFGSLYGIGVWVCFAVLRQFNLPEYYDKLLIVPFLNLSVQLIDGIAGWSFLGALARWEAAFGFRKLNAVHMACWAALCGTMLATGFVQARHPGTSIAFWEQAAQEGRPHAAENLITKLTLLSYTGNADACRELGKIYEAGKIVPKDLAAAAKNFARARELAASPGEMNGVAPTPFTPELLAKMQRLLTHIGKDIDVNASLAARLGLTEGKQPWASRQIAGSVKSRPDCLHSFATSRDGSGLDILLSRHTPTRLYIFRSHRDGTLVNGTAIAVDERTGQSTPLAPTEAQTRLNEEFLFWAGIVDQLLSGPPQAGTR
jgi:hypothetical protein